MGNDVFHKRLSAAGRFINLTAWSLGGRIMEILTGIIGFIITLFMLRRKGGVGRHIGAFALGMIITLIPTVMWAGKLPSGWNQ